VTLAVIFSGEPLLKVALKTITMLFYFIMSVWFTGVMYTKLQNFQFKVSHRITATNSFLSKCGLKETELCTFFAEFIALNNT
jgi:hypothetical protein